jgi:aminomethyltransferase
MSPGAGDGPPLTARGSDPGPDPGPNPGPNSGPNSGPTALLSSPLHDRHVALGAKLAPFGGWSMPLEYAGSGVVKEHTAVREAVGVFDVSHLGTATVRGPGAAALLNATLSNDLARIGPGQAQYTLCCDDATGGIVDDLIVYLHGDDHVFLVPNAANTAEVLRRLSAAAPPEVEVRDEHRSTAVLAVQGPRSDAVLEAVGLPSGHDYMSFVEAELDGSPVVVCRTGYTGERGYELVCPAEAAGPLWDALLAAGAGFGILPCGLGARDTLRTEMGYPLHGQDISLDVTPVEARLGWAVGWGKESFWGKAVLEEQRAQGPARTLRGLVATGRGIPRPGMRVLLTPHIPLGEVTSGTYSPTLRKGIGLALVASQVTDGAEVSVDVRGRPEVFTLTRPPFVAPGVRRP